MSLADTFNLKDKVIVITGASSGIGRQCAISCNQMGAITVLLGRDISRLNETLAIISEPLRAYTCSVDLLEFDKVAEIVSEIVTRFGSIDGLINCAGISTTLPINAGSSDKFEYYLKTNVIGPMNLTRQIVRSGRISSSGASIIFVSSVMALVGEKGKTLYSTTKGALLAGVRSMAVELAPRKIRVNSVVPGVVETPMSQKAVYSSDEESLRRIKELHPLGLGLPEDVANACMFLLSDASRWITGTSLIIDGGYTAR
jgi:NAD(P)-dependent dehydrogenase (short-subunit alcohol dehydrogenase family)